MTYRQYRGSCHCQAVQYEAEFDLSAGSNRCNCSLCSKARAWFVFVPATKLRMIQGESNLADYQWTPPNRPSPHLHYRFCKTCGIRLFGEGNLEALGGPFRAVAVAVLEDADADTLATSIKYVDGRNDRFDQEPADTRLL